MGDNINILFKKSLHFIVLSVFISSSLASEKPLKSDGSSAHEWLMEMSRAMRTKNFQGDVAYLKNNQIETIRVTHANYDGFEREHILTLSGPMREVIREPDKVTCYFPESKTKITNYNRPDEHSLFARLPKNFKNYRGQYRFILTDTGYVTGRKAQKISIIPNDSLRYGQKIWIDSESKLPLKYELFGQDGKVIEQMIFTSISLKQQISPRYFNSQIDARDFKEVHHLKKREKEVENSAWRFSELPVGFEITSHSLQVSTENESESEHLVLSDGLVSVSIYVEKNSQPSAVSKMGAFGGVNAYMRTIDGFLVTVMGEVPAETVKLMADAIRWQRQ